MEATQGTSFSSQGEDAINRQITLDCERTPELQPNTPEFDEYYDIEWTLKQIQAVEYKRIALQFPDHLLPHSVPIFRSLRSNLRTEQEVYILADTSYGSCCVDEVAAQHVNADLIVHYGHACMSHPCRLPVLYVFGREHLDVTHCVQRFLELVPAIQDHDSIASLKLDVVYAHCGDELAAALKAAGVKLTYSSIPRQLNPVPSARLSTSDDQPSPETATILYVGPESLHLTNILMTHSSTMVYRYDTDTKLVTTESTRTNKMLMRRYTAVQKARDADIVGILVGTLGVASYLPLISHLREIIERAQKKSYTISVGKLNPSKLANFLEIECFVLVACPENSIIESKEYFRPIVTPYELQISLQAEPTWTGRYVLDFDGVLTSRSSPERHDGNEEEVDIDQPVFSLLTGKYRHAKRYGGHHAEESNEPQTNSTSVILRSQESTVARLSDSAAANFLHDRSYKGLEMRLGQDAPSVLEQGRSGIARGYQDDHPDGEAN